MPDTPMMSPLRIKSLACRNCSSFLKFFFELITFSISAKCKYKHAASHALFTTLYTLLQLLERFDRRHRACRKQACWKVRASVSLVLQVCVDAALVARVQDIRISLEIRECSSIERIDADTRSASLSTFQVALRLQN
jgi:hypothetical protein